MEEELRSYRTKKSRILKAKVKSRVIKYED